MPFDLPACLPTYLPTYLPTCLPTCLPTYLQNGSGKSTLLKCIASRSVPIPDFVDIWFLDREAEPTDRTAMETVIDTVRYEKARRVSDKEVRRVGVLGGVEWGVRGRGDVASGTVGPGGGGLWGGGGAGVRGWA